MDDDPYVEYAEIVTIALMIGIPATVLAVVGFVEYITEFQQLIVVESSSDGSITIADGAGDGLYVLGMGFMSAFAAMFAIATKSAISAIDEHHPGAELPY